jgi:hypothetical protein
MLQFFSINLVKMKEIDRHEYHNIIYFKTETERVYLFLSFSIYNCYLAPT